MVKSDDHPRTDRDDEERWFGGRRWTGYAAIGFVVVIAVCAGILVLVRHGSSATAGVAPVAPGGVPATVASPAVSSAAPATEPSSSAQVSPAAKTPPSTPSAPT